MAVLHLSGGSVHTDSAVLKVSWQSAFKNKIKNLIKTLATLENWMWQIYCKELGIFRP